MKGKEKRDFSTNKVGTISPVPYRVPARNIIPYLPGPVGITKKVTTPLEAFELFFDKTLIKIKILHTNQEVAKQRANYRPTTTYTKDLDMLELKAFFGVLYLNAVNEDNSVSTTFLCEFLAVKFTVQ